MVINMKIERINDNQIRCTLTGEDLAKRQLKISELAYGTEKAKQLFSDMMKQAAIEFGFEAENVPLMIEAVPLRSNGIVLIITKVENPEELDARFSNFSPQVRGKVDSTPSNAQREYENPFQPLYNALRPVPNKDSNTLRSEEVRQFQQTNRLFNFATMSDVIRAAKIVSPSYIGQSGLYENHLSDSSETIYYLLLTMPDEETVNKLQMTLASLSEYGKSEWISSSRKSYIENHCRAICKENAIGRLAEL